jgi:FHA domain
LNTIVTFFWYNSLVKAELKDRKISMEDDRTRILSAQELEERNTLLQKTKKKGTAELGDGKAESYSILLLIRGLVEKIVIEQGLEYQLGRFEGGERHQIDLSSHGAVERGVSRLHASLRMEDVHLYIIDHGSTNGTFVDGEKIEANQLTQLHSGSEVVLGRLTIQIMFQ